METTLKKKEEKRIEIRVSKKDKELFEHALLIEGFKSISEFFRYILTRESRAIVAREKQILKSERDKKIFFNALMNEEFRPNKDLVSAIEFYNENKE